MPQLYNYDKCKRLRSKCLGLEALRRQKINKGFDLKAFFYTCTSLLLRHVGLCGDKKFTPRNYLKEGLN